MVIQGIKDRSEIRRYKVTEKQGCGDEGETREAREGKQGKTWRQVSVGRRGDPGKIHRSRGFGVQECWKWERRGQQDVPRVRGIEGGQ